MVLIHGALVVLEGHHVVFLPAHDHRSLAGSPGQVLDVRLCRFLPGSVLHGHLWMLPDQQELAVSTQSSIQLSLHQKD